MRTFHDDTAIVIKKTENYIHMYERTLRAPVPRVISTAESAMTGMTLTKIWRSAKSDTIIQ